MTGDIVYGHLRRVCIISVAQAVHSQSDIGTAISCYSTAVEKIGGEPKVDQRKIKRQVQCIAQVLA